MRAWIWMAGLLVGLAVTSRGHAQLVSLLGNSGGTTQTTTSSVGTGPPSNYLGSTFRLRNLFPSFGSLLSTRQPVTYTIVPDPNSPAYMQAFGFRALR
jgi:hypothetical protein